MSTITAKYFSINDFNSAISSTVIRLSPGNKLPVSSLKDMFDLRTVEEIEDGVAVLIGYDKHGDSRTAYTPNTTINITGRPKVSSRSSPRSSSDKSVYFTASMIENLAPIDLKAQEEIWKSTTRIRCEYACGDFMGTSIVVDKDDNDLYILTNLHLLGNGKDMMKRVSSHFQREIKDLTMVTDHLKKKIRSIESEVDIESIDPPRIFIDQLREDKMVCVMEFILEEKVCWEASAGFDFMIFKVPVPENCSLEPCDYNSFFPRRMPMHIFGFPGALVDDPSFSQQYAIIPAQLYGIDHLGRLLLSTLSPPGFSGSAVICTQNGVPIGYLGDGFYANSGKDQCRCYGHIFSGLPGILPRFSIRKKR